ncbi:hypothetical protein D0869_00122 [Hortaea werneckii]|uniref:Structure-specific endonuclease subunit SLX4 n=1 Tax=Hortaea werneckii TaxID=91943 RepID=A0A3M6XII2_HORWE|nr:hypothetical protein KC324_g725 [Hortaea werneckii]KAI7592036.1 hypothetical protein KC316_g2532 [Hortaea werneckii]RMX90481.1 hypothetical protein D0869_00122 [Hortaea werneckii]RMY16633.1 hypothetical protein D0868_00203 [Hortaea werneckii]
MAGANPILIQSSPTSPAAHGRAPVPSSPQLPSPSSFIRPLSSGFPSEAQDRRGPRALEFQSAASLLPLARDDATGGDDGGLAARETTETAGKLKKPKRRMKKSESIILNSDEPEESVYFARKSPLAEPPKRPPVPSADHHESETAPAHASRRRRSWTPVMDTAIHVPSPAPRVPLSELLSNFSYTNSNPGAASLSGERIVNGEATTKRRKIELADSSTVVSVTRQPAKKAPKPKSAKKDMTEKASESTEMPPEKPTKRSKGPKKPQTITALATKAYQPFVEPEAEQSTVSAFFTPPKQDLPATHHTEETVTEPVKAKKPRKPRQPKEGSDAAKGPAKQKATTKPKKAKAKVKFNEADFLPPLYSPEKAALQMQQQDFLFGTSSQLATDEDPKFIREMQTAMAASEMIGPGSQAPTQRDSSCTKIPTAPHGTSLSVGQADRELWCSAARDFKGGLHREKSGLNKPRPAPAVQAAPKESAEPVEAGPSCVKTPPEPQRAPVDSNASHKQTEAAAGGPTATTPPEPDGFIDIDEIYDDDPSPPTPSPPRRRPSSAASPILPLTFCTTSASTPPSVQNKPSTALATTAYLKSTDPQWSTIHPTLFPQISQAIRAETPSITPSQPSWNQKILLYDPIVLEDLTAWLNEKAGIRIPVLRKVAKKQQLARGKNGEKKDEESEEQEVEVNDEEVKAWMVQKWCEERSICCLWKEGLRGGVRSRY